MRQGLNKPAIPTDHAMLFRLYLWPDRLLLLGPGFDTGFHRHHAAQFCVGLEAPLRLRGAENEAWKQAQGFFVAPDRPHQFDATGGPIAMLYLEAESADCRRQLDALRSAAGAIVAPAGIPALQRLWRQGGDIAEAAAASRLLLGDDGITRSSSGAIDPRLSAAIAWIGERIRTPIRIAEVADAVHMSESHLAHLFSEQIGVPLRRYVLWRRLRTALDLAMRGASLTAAAHDAGFADSAHLSRTFKETFGVTPSFLFEHREHIDLHYG